MPANPNPILFKLSATVSEREGLDLLHSGDISAGEYNSMLIAGRTLNRIADHQLFLLSLCRRPRGGSYDEKRF